MQESFRKSHLTMVLFGPLAVAASVATYLVGRPQVLSGVELALPDTGVGAGNTTILVKVNGVAVIAATSIAGASATKAVISGMPSPSASSPVSFPAGVRLRKGDVVTVDITAIPGTTPPKGGSVYLDLTQMDA